MASTGEVNSRYVRCPLTRLRRHVKILGAPDLPQRDFRPLTLPSQPCGVRLALTNSVGKSIAGIHDERAPLLT